MSHTMQNNHYQLTLNPGQASWSLYGMGSSQPYLEEIGMEVRYRLPGPFWTRPFRNPIRLLSSWAKTRVTAQELHSEKHGSMQSITVEFRPDQRGISPTILFALPEEHPLFLWRIILENRGTTAVEVDRLELLRGGMFQRKRRLMGETFNPRRDRIRDAGRGTIRPHPDPGQLGFFSHGWQSWSHTGAYSPEDRYRNTRLGFLSAPMWYDPGTPRPSQPGHFASDMFGVLGDRDHRTGILAGFLSQQEHFGALETWISDPLYPALRLWANGDQALLEPDSKLQTDWACLQFVNLDTRDPLGPYLDAVAREHDLRPFPAEKVQSGWCSWYHFFQDISEKNIQANLHAAAALQPPESKHKPAVPLDLFQIDDGFQEQIGDWFQFSPGFPRGVAPLAREIRARGFIPGLWLAPFIVHSRSKLAKHHPDWLLRNRWGMPANAGYVWNNFNKALDLTHPEALAYACDVVRTAAQEWGYPYLKLDFLYAAALKGRYRDRTKTRAQVLRRGLETLRDAVGEEVTLLGCGVPLGPALGLVEIMRIGADVAPRWPPEWNQRDFFFPREPNMPSTRNALQNILTRAPFHRRWWINDPDCLLVRPDTELTLAETRSLATAIALSGGSLLISDDLPNVPRERLRLVRQLLPLIGKRPWVLDWFDEPKPRLMRLDLENASGSWHLLAVFNWADQPETEQPLELSRFQLPPGRYLAREFWTGAVHKFAGVNLPVPEIPPHGVRLLSLRSLNVPDLPLYSGGNLHLSQGLEVQTWSAGQDGVDFVLKRPGQAQGHMDLYLPVPPFEISVNQKSSNWSTINPDIYRVPVNFQARAQIQIILRSPS